MKHQYDLRVYRPHGKLIKKKPPHLLPAPVVLLRQSQYSMPQDPKPTLAPTILAPMQHTLGLTQPTPPYSSSNQPAKDTQHMKFTQVLLLRKATTSRPGEANDTPNL